VKLQRVAELVFKLKYEHNYGDVHILKEYRAELEKLNRDVFGKFGTFRLPINPRLEATSLDVEKCKYVEPFCVMRSHRRVISAQPNASAGAY